jgi:hypothetical protein
VSGDGVGKEAWTRDIHETKEISLSNLIDRLDHVMIALFFLLPRAQLPPAGLSIRVVGWKTI